MSPWMRRMRLLAATTLCVGLLAACSGGDDDAGGGGGGAITAVKGSACGYFVNVGLFGGPQMLRGCGQGPDAPPGGSSPSVALPEPGGSATPITASDGDGAVAQYGPARIFAGRWPVEVDVAPPSGPTTVSTEGTPGSGSVKSSVDIVLRTPADPASPGGFGPTPVEGDELHASCTASADAVTGSTRFVKGLLATTTDADGNPKDSEPIPDNPPVNYTRSGVISNVGDVFTVVFNEQIPHADGSLTVNAVHMYLFGPTAVGEAVKGQVTCGVTPSPLATDDKVAPACGQMVVELQAPEAPPKVPRTELIGVFDAGGLQAIENVQVTNGRVQVGKPDGPPYARFQPGQTGPVAVTAIRSPEGEAANLPLRWSFDAVDKVGNRARCAAG